MYMVRYHWVVVYFGWCTWYLPKCFRFFGRSGWLHFYLSSSWSVFISSTFSLCGASSCEVVDIHYVKLYALTFHRCPLLGNYHDDIFGSWNYIIGRFPSGPCVESCSAPYLIQEWKLLNEERKKWVQIFSFSTGRFSFPNWPALFYTPSAGSRSVVLLSCGICQRGSSEVISGCYHIV